MIGTSWSGVPPLEGGLDPSPEGGHPKGVPEGSTLHGEGGTPLRMGSPCSGVPPDVVPRAVP